MGWLYWHWVGFLGPGYLPAASYVPTIDNLMAGLACYSLFTVSVAALQSVFRCYPLLVMCFHSALNWSEYSCCEPVQHFFYLDFYSSACLFPLLASSIYFYLLALLSQTM